MFQILYLKDMCYSFWAMFYLIKMKEDQITKIIPNI